MYRNQFLRNVACNWGNLLLGVGVVYFLTPFVVRSLGDDRYGWWVLTNELTGYYGFLDLGLRPAVGQFVTRYLAQGDRGRLKATVETAHTLLLLGGAAILLLALLGALLFPLLFTVPAGHVAETRWAVLIVGGGIACRFPFALFQSLLAARHRFDLMSAVSMGMTLARAGLTVAVLQAGHGLPGLAAVVAATGLGEGLLHLAAVRGLLPELRFRLLRFDRASLLEMRNYGFFSFLANVAERVIFYTDSLVIGLTLAPAAVTYYAVGASLLPYLGHVVRAIAWPLTQIAISLDATAQEEEMRRLFLRGTRYILALVSLLAGALFTAGPEFLGLWMGARFLAGEPFASSGDVLRLLLPAHLFFLAFHAVGLNIVAARRKNHVLAAATAVEAAANLGLSLLLIHPYGILGVAAGTLFPMCLMRGVVLPALVSRYAGVTAWRFWAEAVAPNLVPLGGAVGAGLWLLPGLGPAGWEGLALRVAGYLAIHALLAGALTFRAELLGLCTQRRRPAMGGRRP